MLTLYYKPTCIFSSEVIEAASSLGLTLHLIDASFDEAVKNELLRLGGKQRVPLLIDSSRQEALYESKIIIEYLRRNYSPIQRH